MPPVVTSLSSPAVRGDTLHVIGTGFGFVSSAALYETSTQTLTNVEFFVDSGTSIHLTIPLDILDGTYAVRLGTLHNDGTVSTATITLPDDTPTPPPSGSFQANPIPDYQSANMLLLRQRTRLELGDYAETFSATATADGVGDRYDLPAEVVDPTSLVVMVDGATVSSANYTLDASAGVLTLHATPTAGQIVKAVGTNYQFFSDTELDVFILSAALKHTHNVTDETAYRAADGFKYYTIGQRTVDTVAPVELHPIALLSAIEALDAMAADAAFDISVQTAEGTSLGREERFGNITALIGQKTEKYEDICLQLGVGLSRVEVFNLRRVSRTTGRLVPVYRQKEYDDRSLPERLYLHIDSGLSGSDTEGVDPYYGGGAVWP